MSGMARLEVRGDLAATVVRRLGVFVRLHEDVDELCDAISARLSQKGLVVHDLQRAAPGGDFVGLSWREDRPVVSIRRARLWRLRRALAGTLARPRPSGHALRILLGHLT